MSNRKDGIEQNALVQSLRDKLFQIEVMATSILFDCLDVRDYFNGFKKGEEMDKQIKKVQKSIEKSEKSLDKGEKQTKKLLKMDKAFDKKLAKCGIKEGKKK